jgi:hypothetical protein
MAAYRAEDVCYVNCACCHKTLVGERSEKEVWATNDTWPKGLPEPVAVRVGGRYGRPLCADCRAIPDWWRRAETK